ncbi:MAG TPA: hypothetical protein VFU31_21005 [Candidatus Binatia bacterium]|nr:hypothetical protein [Candidatus Binatia bacterium]
MSEMEAEPRIAPTLIPPTVSRDNAEMLESEHADLRQIDKRLSVLETQFTFERRISGAEIQNARIVSDIESEKGTTRRVNAQIDADIRTLSGRVSAVEKAVWMGVGIIIAVQTLLSYLLKN